MVSGALYLWRTQRWANEDLRVADNPPLQHQTRPQATGTERGGIESNFEKQVEAEVVCQINTTV
jgi:hypothetical protein